MNKILLLVLFLAILSACAPEVKQGYITPGATDTAPSATPPIPTLQTEAVQGIGTPLPGLLLQYDIVPSFWYPERYHPSGRVPRFTLFENGALIYVESSESGERALQVQLSPEEAVSLVEQALELGFERLESHTDSCPPPDFADQSCLADGNTHIYRVRLSSGELRQVAIYEHFANDPQAHESLQEFFGNYGHSGAELFQPEMAALFVVEPPDPSAPPQDAPLRDWPFDPGWLSPGETGEWMWARALSGEELAMVMQAFGSNMGSFYFPHKGGYYRATLVSWLPGADYSAKLP